MEKKILVSINELKAMIKNIENNNDCKTNIIKGSATGLLNIDKLNDTCYGVNVSSYVKYYKDKESKKSILKRRFN